MELLVQSAAHSIVNKQRYTLAYTGGGQRGQRNPVNGLNKG